MSEKIEQLKAHLSAALDEKMVARADEKGQLLIEVKPADLTVAMTLLRDDATLGFSS